jgi:hypothetical protein
MNGRPYHDGDHYPVQQLQRRRRRRQLQAEVDQDEQPEFQQYQDIMKSIQGKLR